jgi:hypothetical protein
VDVQDRPAPGASPIEHVSAGGGRAFGRLSNWSIGQPRPLKVEADEDHGRVGRPSHRESSPGLVDGRAAE